MKKTLQLRVEQTIVPEDEYLNQDQEILTFFVEELEDILLQLDDLLHQWQSRPEQAALWAELRRRFHTIKGSGRLVGAHVSAELAWTVEHIFNQLQVAKVQYSDHLQHYVMQVTQLFKHQLLADLSAGQPHRIDLRPAILLGQCLVSHEAEREDWIPELSEIVEQQCLGQYEAAELSNVSHVKAQADVDVLEVAVQDRSHPHMKDQNVEESDLDQQNFEQQTRAEQYHIAHQHSLQQNSAVGSSVANASVQPLKSAVSDNHSFWSYSNQFPADVIDLNALISDSSLASAPVQPAAIPVQEAQTPASPLAEAELTASSEAAEPQPSHELIGEAESIGLEAPHPAALVSVPDESDAGVNQTVDQSTAPAHTETLAAELAETAQPSFTVSNALLTADDEETVFQIFLQEADEQLNQIEAFVQLPQPTEQQHNDLIRVIHTLRGGSAIAKLETIVQASQQVEHWLAHQTRRELETENGLLLHYLEYVRDYLYVLKQNGLTEDGLKQDGLQPDGGQQTQLDQSPLSAIQSAFDDAWVRYQRQASYQHQHEQSHLISELLALDIEDVLNAEIEFSTRVQQEFPDYLDSLIQQLDKLIQHCQYASVQGIYQYAQVLKFSYQLLIQSPHLLQHAAAQDLLAQMHQQFIQLFDALATGQYTLLSEQALQLSEALPTYLLEQMQLADEFQLQADAAETGVPEFELESQDASALQSAAEQLDLKLGEGETAPVVNPQGVLPLVQDEAEPEDEHEPETEVASQDTAESETISELHYLEEQQTLSWTERLQQAILADHPLQFTDQANHDLDPDVLEFFIEEAQELLESIQQEYQIWQNNLQNEQPIQQLMRHLHTFKGGANMLPARYLADITHELESLYQRILRKQTAAGIEMVQIIGLLQHEMGQRIQIIMQAQIDFPAPHTLSVIQQVMDTELDADQMSSAADLPQLADASAIPAFAAAVRSEIIATPEPELLTHSASTELKPTSEQEKTPEEISREVFLQEASELLVQANTMLSQWFEQRGNRSVLLQLQRIAHSIKGGARMVQQLQVAEIAYALETTFEQFAIQNFNSNAYDGLLNYALVWLRKAILQQQFEHFASLKAGLDHIEYVETSAQLPDKIANANQQLSVLSFNSSNGDGVEPPSMLGEWIQPLQQEDKEDVLRVSAELVEKLIDLSGENAINRAHVEMDLSQLETTLNEMELAIRRMADQLRRMEGELESQIITQHGQAGKRYHDFDLLEMDEYSALNQLSKALAESASDLLDYKATLVAKVKDTESVLLRQTRIQSELQQGLMQARLVPFSHMLPRLQKLVRQVSETLQKPTELQVRHAEGEVDRTILDRLVSPIEHMLRNALDHGIESPDQRAALGKPPQGQLALTIAHEGAELVVTVQDDGRGLDVAKIRHKAEQLELVQAGLPYSDQELLQFIFHPGFSTAEKLTQISGRGVGLDIVQSEIKAIGGQVIIDSVLGQGTTFSIRVPTSVAISDALMVKVAGQQFAVPLTQIERVIRVPVAQLASYFNSHADELAYHGTAYRVRYLAEFIGQSSQPDLQESQQTQAVLVLKDGSEQHLAVLVDELIGSRSQIVMKSVGEQFAQVDIVAGATILGDGQVCLILDGQSMAQQILSSRRLQLQTVALEQAAQSEAVPLIMVVDDSVTVRKVTTKLLERYGYQVVTANDGLDATTQLEHLRPDVMLLDIEMPRMDGFEVTHWVRHHAQLHQLPIIMITSRVGEKHRERALSLGATHYMGKPFQEDQLIQTIQSMLTHHQAQGAYNVPD